LSDCLTEDGLVGNVIGLCADNTYYNFGGAGRKSQNTVFTKLQENLRRALIGVGWTGHIFHNTLSQNITTTNLTQSSLKLKEFCDFVETEFEIMLGYAQRRWLALLLTIERVVKLFLPLKSYFQSQDKCPFYMLNFFENLCLKCGCTFFHSQASSFHEAMKKVVG
jgi:hypothetical protein